MSSVEISYREEELRNYVREILSLELCRLFFPVSFVQRDGKLTGIYEAEGFRSLSSAERLSTADILMIAASLLRGVRQAEDRYIFAQLYAIDEESVFIDDKCSTVRLIFVPSCSEETVFERLASLLRRLREKGHEDGLSYVDKSIRFLQSGTCGYKTVIRRLEELRREVYLCGVK